MRELSGVMDMLLFFFSLGGSTPSMELKTRFDCSTLVPHMFYFLIGICVTPVYALVKAQGMMHLRLVHFIVLKFYRVCVCVCKKPYNTILDTS